MRIERNPRFWAAAITFIFLLLPIFPLFNYQVQDGNPVNAGSSKPDSSMPPSSPAGSPRQSASVQASTVSPSPPTQTPDPEPSSQLGPAAESVIEDLVVNKGRFGAGSAIDPRSGVIISLPPNLSADAVNALYPLGDMFGVVVAAAANDSSDLKNTAITDVTKLTSAVDGSRILRLRCRLGLNDQPRPVSLIDIPMKGSPGTKEGSCGSNTTSATPFQMAVLMSALAAKAADGDLTCPHLPERPVPLEKCPEEKVSINLLVARSIRDRMVTTFGDSSKGIALMSIGIPGKNEAWAVGFATGGEPRIAVAVHLAGQAIADGSADPMLEGDAKELAAAVLSAGIKES